MILDDLCESTFLQTAAAVLLFILILVWLCRKRGQLPREAVLQAERLTGGVNTVSPPVKRAAFQSTPESRALLEKLRAAVVALEPTKLSHLTFHESDDTRIDNKKMVFLCLRDPATGELYPWNALIYVTIHEMAHAISEGYDPMHTSQEFQSNFWSLLRKAERAGVYKPSEGFLNEYCALPLDKNDPGIVIR